jgi:PleD family two-component response regulator
VHGKTGVIKLRVVASMGLAERAAGEEMKDLLARADAAMYEEKGKKTGIRDEGFENRE